MDEALLAETLFFLAIIFFATLIIGASLARLHIPMILSALFIGIAAHYLPWHTALQTPVFETIFTFLADLGVLFLLFYIGLQIDIGKMRHVGTQIISLTFLNTIVPFLLATAAMLWFNYPLTLAFVIGMTQMPTAEAVIVPILDKFGMINTKIGALIIGAGILDDIIEVFLVTVVSVWIGVKSEAIQSGDKITILVFGILAFFLFSWIMFRYFPLVFQHYLPRKPIPLLLLAFALLFLFGAFSQKSDTGMVVGAIFTGIVLKPILKRIRPAGQQVEKFIAQISYSFFGVIFFFWIGFHIDLAGFIREPTLAIVIYLAGTLGKLLGTFLMVPLRQLDAKEALLTGIGINARLTTEIIVVQLLYSAHIIDLHLFTALVAASSFTTLTVPLLFTFLVRRFHQTAYASVPATDTQRERQTKG